MYTFVGRKCGTVRFIPSIGTVNGETVNRTSTVTDNPIENGSSISDHVFTQPRTFNVQGTVVDGAATIAALDAMWKKRDIITYTGRNQIGNLVIQSLKSDRVPKNRKGFNFTATIKQVTIGTADDSGTSAMMTAQDKAAASSSGSGGSGGRSASQTTATRADGLKTTVSTKISSSAYSQYVASYNKKSSSSGPSSRSTPSNSGRR